MSKIAVPKHSSFAFLLALPPLFALTGCTIAPASDAPSADNISQTTQSLDELEIAAGSIPLQQSCGCEDVHLIGSQPRSEGTINDAAQPYVHPEYNYCTSVNVAVAHIGEEAFKDDYNFSIAYIQKSKGTLCVDSCQAKNFIFFADPRFGDDSHQFRIFALSGKEYPTGGWIDPANRRKKEITESDFTKPRHATITFSNNIKNEYVVGFSSPVGNNRPGFFDHPRGLGFFTTNKLQVDGVPLTQNYWYSDRPPRGIRFTPHHAQTILSGGVADVTWSWKSNAWYKPTGDTVDGYWQSSRVRMLISKGDLPKISIVERPNSGQDSSLTRDPKSRPDAGTFPNFDVYEADLFEKFSRTTTSDWRKRAYRSAGIDESQWDPSKGFSHNIEVIKKVYDFYKRAFAKDENLRWAGMARLAGGEVFRGLIELQNRINDYKQQLDAPNLSGPGERAARSTTVISAGFTEALQKRLISMQKDIFLDLGWQLQAYLEGGLPALRAAYDQGADLDIAAWRNIVSGDGPRVRMGNKALLHREQACILKRHYEEIRSLPDFDLVPYVMSELALSPIPGGKSFGEIVPNGDVTIFDDRWEWIEKDMLPAYERLSPRHLQELLGIPIETLSERNFPPAPIPERQPDNPVR